MKVSNIVFSGASKSRVKMMFNEPDSKEISENKSEIWIYKHREDDKTIKIIFTSKGAVQKIEMFLPDGTLDKSITVAH